MSVATFFGCGATSTSPDSFAVFVDGVDYSDTAKNTVGARVRLDSISISAAVGANATATFTIDAPARLVLPLWGDVVLWDGGVSMYRHPTGRLVALPNGILFSGVITGYAVRDDGAVRRHVVRATDYGILLDRRYVPGPIPSYAGATWDVRKFVGMVANLGGLAHPIWLDVVTSGLAFVSGLTGSGSPSAGTARSLFDQCSDARYDSLYGDTAAWVAPDRRLVYLRDDFVAWDYGNWRLSGTAGDYFGAPNVRDDADGGDCVFEQIVFAGPRGYWRLGDTSGTTAVDEVGREGSRQVDANLWTFTPGRCPGTYVNTPTLNQVGAVNGGAAASFASASSEYVTVAHDERLNVGDVVTFECWAKRSSTGAHALVSKGSGALEVLWNADGTISARKGGTGAFLTSTGTMATDFAWHHLMVVKNGGSAAIYIDGVNAGGAYSAQTLVDTTAALVFGRDSAGANYLNGQLCEVAWHAVALGPGDAHLRARTASRRYGSVVASDVDVDVDAASAETAAWDSATGRFAFSSGSIASAADVSGRALSTGTFDSTYTLVESVLAPKGLRFRVTFKVVGRSHWRAGQNVRIDLPSWGVEETLTIVETRTAFRSGDGTRETRVVAVGGGSPSGGARSQAQLNRSLLSRAGA